VNRKEGRAGRPWVLAICLLVGCFVFSATIANATTVDRKAKTKVSITFEQDADDDELFSYATKIKKPRKCRKNRQVIVYHDENGNGKRDSGEFVIGGGKTNRRGRFEFESRTAPPEGDKIGVEVKKNRKCKAGKASTRA
jgi:hypothetical protein